APPSNLGKLGGFNNSVFIAELKVTSYAIKQVSLDYLADIARRIHQLQLCPLSLVIAIQKGKPSLVLFDPCPFDLTQIRLALLKSGLKQLQVLLRQFQLQPGDLARRIELAQPLILVGDIEFHVLALVLHRRLSSAQLAPC